MLNVAWFLHADSASGANYILKCCSSTDQMRILATAPYFRVGKSIDKSKKTPKILLPVYYYSFKLYLKLSKTKSYVINECSKLKKLIKNTLGLCSKCYFDSADIFLCDY